MNEIEIEKVPLLPQSYDDYEDDTVDKRICEEFAMNYIRYNLSEMFFLEGKNRDYYFGKSPLNKGLTVFYNNSHVGESVCGVVRGIAGEFWRTNLRDKDFTLYDTIS